MFGISLMKNIIGGVTKTVYQGLHTAVETYQEVRAQRIEKNRAAQSASRIAADGEDTENKREKLRQNLLNKDDQEHFDELEKSRQTSMLHSQGEPDHSGSSYHGPGKPMSGKTNSNMWQRNFNNHQGN
jgi:hypothetical protein